MKTVGYAAHSPAAHMVPYHFERRDLRENDVAIEILYSGICHSDLHTVNGDWGPQPYPLVPGHEIVGQVGPMEEFITWPLISGRRRVAGSLIGGIKETQEVLDFCAEHNIHPECKMIRPDEVNDAFAHLKKRRCGVSFCHGYVANG